MSTLESGTLWAPLNEPLHSGELFVLGFGFLWLFPRTKRRRLLYEVIRHCCPLRTPLNPNFLGRRHTGSIWDRWSPQVRGILLSKGCWDLYRQGILEGEKSDVNLLRTVGLIKFLSVCLFVFFTCLFSISIWQLLRWQHSRVSWKWDRIIVLVYLITMGSKRWILFALF